MNELGAAPTYMVIKGGIEVSHEIYQVSRHSAIHRSKSQVSPTLSPSKAKAVVRFSKPQGVCQNEWLS